MCGPGPAYVELIAPGSDESNLWLDRVRYARGPTSWAIAVVDIEAARTALCPPSTSRSTGCAAT